MTTPIPPELLVGAYCSGAFPMAGEDGGIGWYSPDPRGIIPLDAFHMPRGLRRTLRSGAWEIRVNHDFQAVMRACMDRPSTWIDGEIFRSYCELHTLGAAHSVEVWRDGHLAGGLYGVALGGAFFGESMFHRVTDASKVALAHLVALLRSGGFRLLDIQWKTDHLARFGAIEIPREDYLRMLEAALGERAIFPREAMRDAEVWDGLAPR